MANKSRWKDFERLVAKELGGKRKIRADYGVSAPDIIFEEEYLAHVKIDCKKRINFKHHHLMDEIYTKYCKNGDMPLLITKVTRGRKFTLVSLPIEHFKKIFTLYKKHLKEGVKK